MSDQWQAGVYEGIICGTASGSAATGTPWFDVRFNIGGHEKAVRWYFSEKSADRSLRELATLGFNADFENPVFTVTTPVRLQLEYETNEGRNGKQYTNARWRLDSVGAPLQRDQLLRLNAMAKAIGGSAIPPPPSAPPLAGGRPSPPPVKSATPPPPFTPTAPAASTPPVKEGPRPPCTRDQAWAVINDAARWAACVEAVAKEVKKQEADFTDTDWASVLDEAGIPF